MAPFCQAQVAFIKATRSKIDANPRRFFGENDWREIRPKGGRNTPCASNKTIDVTSFYIKPVASFVPHLLLPNHIPSCPHCEKKEKVDTHGANVRWINCPKILFGMKCHRYLDTKLYWCSSCRKRFAGHDKKSMKLDSKEWLGFFPFNLSERFAVDDELCSFVINSANSTTTSIVNHLKRMSTDNYHNDYQHYLYLVRSNRVKPRTSHNNQKRIDSHFSRRKEKESANERKSNTLKMKLDCATRKLATARSKLASGLPLQNIINLKQNRNQFSVTLRYLGVAKLTRLMEMGITTGAELLESENPYVKSDWKLIVEDHFEQIRSDIEEPEESVNDLQEEELLHNIAISEERSQLSPPDNNDNALTTVNDLPPVFSEMEDCMGYNGKTLSWTRVNSILRTEFSNRKLLQESKMRGLTATILKFDFQYEIAKKIRVWTGQGKSYRPYYCILTVLNELGMCVFWKALKSPETFKEVKNDLVALQKRLQYNAKATTCPVKAAYIDNCCTVANVDGQLKKIFVNAWIGLDVFHWMKRFDKIMASTTTKEASLFRSMLHRAVFVVNDEEFHRAKDVVRKKKGRMPTTKEILKESRSTIPKPEVLRKRVMEVINYALHVDCVTEKQRLEGEESTKLPRFFKPVNGDVRHLIMRQLHHVDHGCLSDPTNCDMHITNPATGIHYCTRGTSHNEVFNKYMNALLGNSIGIERGDRLLCGFFEVMNDQRRIHRLGEIDYGTSRTEVLALLNSIAAGAGYSANEIPFPKLSTPSLLPNRFKEGLGLNWQYPKYDNVSNPTNTTDLHDYDPELADYLLALDFDAIQEDDSESAAEDLQEEEEEETIEPIRLEDAQDDEDENLQLQYEVDAEVEHLLVLETRSPETSLQTFNRLTNEEPWIPFRPLNSSSEKSEVDVAEYALFQRMKKDYKRHAAPGASRVGYKEFELTWNLEVAERYRKYMENDYMNHTVLIRRKSYIQLQQHHDNVIESERIGRLANSRQMHDFNKVMKETRLMTAAPTGRLATPVQYITTGLGTPYGAPTTLNAEIGRQGVIRNDFNNQNATPWSVQGPSKMRVTNALTGFSKAKWCVTCGFQKKQHTKEERFGSKCTRNYCANCGELSQYHEGMCMGPYCNKEPKYDSPYRLWYT